MDRIRILSVLLCGLCLTMRAAAAAAEPNTPDFQQQVMPLLKNRCVRCHGPALKKGELNLAIPAGIVRGGETGPSIDPARLEESLLWKRVAADEMPEDEPLPAEEKAILRQWILSGAAGLPKNVPPQPSGDEHWAFQKLPAIELPTVRDASRLRTPLDYFIQAKLEAASLTIGAEADRATLIRRVSFDLTGLPPTLSEVEAFVNDSATDAYERMVDRYFASPRYGERWGKYWLDAAGYADSNGYFGADTDRPLAYRYRDYVIRAINADKPFDQFIREQLAGDELAGYRPGRGVAPEMIDSLEATHFLRNSPDGTDSSDGNPDEQRADKFAVIEGTMQIMGTSLLGITVQCAKCHDHKFEPFTQRDYYQLQAVLFPAFNVDQWVKPKDREILAAGEAEIAAWEARAKEIDLQIAGRRNDFESWLRENQEPGKMLFQDRFDEPTETVATSWSNSVPGDEAAAGQPAVNLDSQTAPGALLRDGKLQIVESRDDGDRALSTKQAFDWTPNDRDGWIQVTFDLSRYRKSKPQVGFFLALRDFNDDRGMSGGNILIDGALPDAVTVYTDYPGSDNAKRGDIGVKGFSAGRNCGVRITNRGDNHYELAKVVDGVIEEGTQTLSAADLPDGGFGFEYCCGRSFTVDNVVVMASDFSPQSKAALQKFETARKQERTRFEKDLKSLEAKKGDKPGRMAIVSDLSKKPPQVFLLDRGDYKSPKDLVQAIPPAVLCEPAPHHESTIVGETPNATSTNSRLNFAQWLTTPDSRAAALLARVTVNRWWQNHFGAGIVPTAENLGYSGAPPANAELLDYLAAELIRQHWSQKAIHRMIVLSAAYRQSSKTTAEQLRADADNRLLSRFPLRRLDAEAVRDGMLAISGELDLIAGGPYVPTKRDDEGDVIVAEKTAGSHRRSVYLQQRRTQVAGILEVFDAPSMVFSCTVRMPTTVPLQSLKLLNSSFVRARSRALAKRIEDEIGTDREQRIRQAFTLALSRQPTQDELAAAHKFIATQQANYPGANDAAERSWIDFCQALLSSSAFFYVE